MCGHGVPPRLGGRQINLEEAVMGSATVQGEVRGTGSHGWAEVVETLARPSCGNFGIVSRFEFALEPVSAIVGVCYRNARQAR